MKCLGDDLGPRMAQLGARLTKGLAVTTEYIAKRYGVSKATAKRDLAMLEAALPLGNTTPRGRGNVGGRVTLKLTETK